MGKPVRLVLPRETGMAYVGGRQEIEAEWEVVLSPDTRGKISAVSYEYWMAHGATRDTQILNVHLIGSAIDMNYAIPNWKLTAHIVEQNLAQRTACRSLGHFEALLLIEALVDGVAAQLDMPAHEVREANFSKKCGPVGLGGYSYLDDYSTLALWEKMKQDTFETVRSEAKDFNAGNVWKKRGVAVVPARFGIFVPAGHQARIDIFKDGSLQIAVSGVEVGQGLHVKIAQAVTTEFYLTLGCGPPLDVIRFRDTSTEHSPNGIDTCGSTATECCVFAAVVELDVLTGEWPCAMLTSCLTLVTRTTAWLIA